MFDIKAEAKKVEACIIEWRRELHMVPEIGSDLPKTTAIIKAALEEMGYEYQVFSNNGIKAVLKGGSPGLTIGFRADMDALPIVEETGLPYSSTNENMHACGHDAHAAMLLGAAKVLSEHRDEIKGNVVFLFQPAEEMTGGAKDMIEEGCMKDPDIDRFISLHVGTLFDDVKNGFVGIKRGPMFAGVSSYYARVIGKGGHGARPNECVDPIVISCEIIQSLQKIVSREIPPVHGAVITTGMLQGGTAVNVIPGDVRFGGTIRTLYEADAALIKKRLPEVIKGIARANGADAEVEYYDYYPPTINDTEVLEFFKECAEKIVGPECITEIKEPTMGTEDVTYYLREVPGNYAILGSVKPAADGIVYPHHNSKFLLDESVLWLGTALFVQCAIDYCN